jgi:preprotein translocase subunit SecY
MEKFFTAVQNMFKVPELRKRILFTLGMLAVYRLGAHVTAPGINKPRLEQVWGEVAGTLLGVLDLFSGGNFRTISVFALGVTPYITASIIMQLMPVLSPQMKKIQEEGEVGRQKMNQWTRYLTVVLCAVQTFFVATWLHRNAIIPETWWATVMIVQPAAELQNSSMAPYSAAILAAGPTSEAHSAMVTLARAIGLVR